ncbi:hypothetical protein [Diplocloster hominis]|uniref:hypothetical protein n=1 Tax=Diplocloster hominis TaxID=3079010 RepID=UPI0031BBCC74
MESWKRALDEEGFGVNGALERVLELWRGIPTEVPAEGIRPVSKKQREENAKRGEAALRRMRRHMKDFPQAVSAQKKWREQGERTVLESMEHDVIFQMGKLPAKVRRQFLEATKEYFRQTRRYDRELRLEELVQGLKNYFVYFMLALAAGEGEWFQRAIWSYSLLYPYTDNFLDGDYSSEQKKRFNEMLVGKLLGEYVETQDRLEEKVCGLIDVIEEIYPRKDFEELYDFLMIIYDAQLGSLGQHGAMRLGEEELLRVSVYKGGASIYVDQCLVNGHMDRRDIYFLTGFGFFLQLADDLQDVQEDLDNGHQTYMTKMAEGKELEKAVGRLLGFVARLFAQAWRGISDVREFMLDNSVQLICTAVLQKPQYYTDEFVRRIEQLAVLPAGFLKQMENEGNEMAEEWARESADPMEMLDVWADCEM